MLKFGSKGDINATFKCTVRLLDDAEVLECEFQPHQKGSHLLEYVCKQLNLLEKDYFGLRYVDPTRQRHWLDLGKTIIKQVKEMDPVLFSFRVKFYPADPFVLKEEITRYQIYLQLKRDLLHGRLYCNQSEAALLGAYIVQAELGDYDPEIHDGNYVADLKILLKQTQPIEDKIIELHQTQLKGQSPATIEMHFLKKACQLDTYGVDPHPVKDHRGNTLYLGINHLGILTFQGSRKTRHFNWSEVQKINYEGKMFIIHLVYHENLWRYSHHECQPQKKSISRAARGINVRWLECLEGIKHEIDPRTKKKHTVGFKCPTGASCRHVWRCAIEQMLFFTLQKSTDAPVVSGGGLFSWGTKFKYTGRTEKEILEDSGPVRTEEPTINRVGSLRLKASSVPATPSTPIGSDLGYSSLPRSNHSAPDSRLNGDHTLMLGVDYPDNSLSLLETVSEDQEHVGKRRIPAVESEERKEESAVKSEKIEKEGLRNGVVNQEGLKEMDSMDDYYFRDSFDQSSSESQLQELGGKPGMPPSHRSSRSQTPQPVHHRLKPGISGTSLQTSSALPGQVVPLPAPPASDSRRSEISSAKKFNLFQVFIPSFLFVAISLIAATILVLESDSELLRNFRRIPEMVALQKEYYEPIKEFFKKRLFKFLSK